MPGQSQWPHCWCTKGVAMIIDEYKLFMMWGFQESYQNLLAQILGKNLVFNSSDIYKNSL